MTKPHSSRLLMIGVAVLLVGAGLVLVVLRHGGNAKTTASATAPTVPSGAAPSTPGVTAPPAAAGAASYVIPEGKQAVAVQLPFTQGLAGYARPGDRVNVFALAEKGDPSGNPRPFSKLLLPNVPVLAVTAPPPEAGTGNATFLLALSPEEAEQVLFFAKFESVWLARVPKEMKVSPTPGRGYKNAL
jgi:Flp pilus assembly protein CpaB